MQRDEAVKKIAFLRKEIKRHEHLYRIENAPEISDDDFDLLMRQLRQLEAQFPDLVDVASPAQVVGSDLSDGFETRQHLSPMLSLDNVFDSSELADFDTRLHKILSIEEPFYYNIEPKIDGAGVSAVYINGKLDRLLTRGDGEKGDDITRNAFVIKNLPLELQGDNVPELLEIRGEVYMTLDEFDRLSNLAIEAEKQKLQKRQKSLLDDAEIASIEKKRPYANPRNLTAGTLKLLDVDVLEQRNLQVIFYSIGQTRGFNLEHQQDLPERLSQLGLPAVNWHSVAFGWRQAFERICELEEVRNDFPFNTDGAVVKLDDCSLHSLAGMTSHAPRWAIAWKYRAQQVSTKLNAITLQVGRTGAVTPVAELEPIFIDGSTVSRATLHNASYIAQKDIRVGDTVIVEKAGEIIPAVIRVELQSRKSDSKPFEFPSRCPECDSILKQYGEKMLYRCPNFSCPPQVKGRIEHFASRDCMDIKGLGESVVSRLVDELGVRSPADIYSLTKEQLMSLDKVKDKTADNLLTAIEKSKNQDLGRLIFALGILEIGERFAKELATKFGSLDALMNASLDEITTVEGLGSKTKASGQNPIRALSVRAFFDDEHNRQLIESLRAHGLNFIQQKTSTFGLFANKVFVLTGSLKSMDRNSAKAKIENLGGKVGSSVSKNTDYLISDGEISSNKMQKALEFGTKIILEDEFLAMLNKSGISFDGEFQKQDVEKSSDDANVNPDKEVKATLSENSKSNENPSDDNDAQMLLGL